MTTQVETLANVIRAEIAKSHLEGTFSVPDFHHMAKDRGLHIKGVTHAMQALIKKGLIERCGDYRNPHGGAPINLYRVIDAEKLDQPQTKKTCKEFQDEAKDRYNRINTAALNLQRALGIGFHTGSGSLDKRG